MSALLSVENLRVGFGQGAATTEVVRGVSFDLAAGETLAIVGESGSGKSVTALSINRLVDFGGGRILGGAIRLARRSGAGVDLATAPEATLQEIRGSEIAMIFQEPMSSLNPVLSIGTQLEEAFRLHQRMTRREARAAAIAALERVRIPDAARRLDAFPHALSGGTLQRVMIASAIACRPRLLIADEPTTALDVTVQAQIMALLAELRREIGMSLIFISHDIGLVAGIADRVLVMRGGEAVETAPLDTILDAPAHAYTRHLLAAVPHFTQGRAVRPDGPRASAGARVADPQGDPAPAPAPGPVAPALGVEHLTVRFPVGGGFLRRPAGEVHAVEDVGFDIAPGETLGLVGESGSGKTTIARSVLGLVRPRRGQIRLGGGPAARAVQMVFQNPYASLNPRLDVEALLAEPLIAAGGRVDAAARGRMAALLDRVGLPADSLRRYPHAFSGGQRQRLAIARALMLQPKVVVLDEPVSALDVSVQALVLELLVGLQRELGLAYLFVSHDMAVVERIAHRVAVLYAGQLVEIGAAGSVLARPAHAYTRRLIAAVPAVSRRRQAYRLEATAMPSLLRPFGTEPPPARWQEVGPDHRVRIEEGQDERWLLDPARSPSAALPA